MDESYRAAFIRACMANAADGVEVFLADLDRVIDEVVAPAAVAVDRDSAHPGAALEALSAIGAAGVQIPREFGGLGHGSGVAALVVERVARACASTAAILMFHYQVVARTLDFADPARRDSDLVAFAGGALAASAWTEPNATRDKRNLTSRLHGRGGDLVVDATKTFCTGLRSASVVDVLLSADLDGARGPTFVRVDTKSAGVEVSDIYPMLGLRGTATGTLTFNAVPVAGTDILGRVGAARELMTANHRTPLNPGLLALGIVSAAYESALRLCRGEYPGIPARHGSATTLATLADSTVQLEMAYSYAAKLITEMTTAPSGAYCHANRLKLFATTTAETLTRTLLHVAGCRGFLASLPFERQLRDAQATVLMGPSNELCRERVASELLPADVQPAGGA